MGLTEHSPRQRSTMDVTIVVSTFGGAEWQELAESRAIPSAIEQAPVIHAHGDTLAKARNQGLQAVESEWVIFLDADDELTPGYVDSMRQGLADLRAPAVEYVGTRVQAPYVPKVAGHRHDCSGDCLVDGNWLVIGSAAKADILREVGGFREYEVYEDWDLWLRAYLAGASVEAVPAAIYRAHVRSDSRNRAPSMQVKNRVHYEIVKAIG